MRGATECAKRLKLFFSSLRSKLGKVERLPLSDPISQMLLGILSRDTPEAKASEGLDRLRSVVVDYNELRVIPPIELAETLGDFPDARLKCEDISRSLNAVFAREHTVSLDRLSSLSKKDAFAYLLEIDGLEAYTVARVRLLGFEHHAIPLDEAMWAVARKEELVAVRCPLVEAQQFVERQVSSDEALEFVSLLKQYAWSEMGNGVRDGEVERITSVPPDRSARNMLQMVSSGGSAGDVEDLDAEPEPAEVEPESETPEPPRPARARKTPAVKAAPKTAVAGKATPAPAAPPKTPAKRAATATGQRAPKAARATKTKAGAQTTATRTATKRAAASRGNTKAAGTPQTKRKTQPAAGGKAKAGATRTRKSKAKTRTA